MVEKAPVLRFRDEDGKEFPRWEERRLGEVFHITRGNVLSIKDIKKVADSEYRYPVYSSQTKNNGLLGFYNQKLYKDSITWTTDGANAGTTIYRNGEFYCTNVCGVLLDDDGNANNCIANIINRISKRHVFNAGNPKLMNNVMSEIRIFFPSLPEQRKIADFLTAYDELIGNQEKRLEALRLRKKGLLQKIFSQQIRFKDDEGKEFPEWEERRLGEVFDYIIDKGHSEKEVLTIKQGIGTVLRKKSGIDIKYNQQSLGTYKLVQKNDFIVHLRSFQAGFEIANSEGIVSPAYTILRNKLPIAFGFYRAYFRTYNFINHNLNLVVEGIRDGRTINVSELKLIKLPLPTLAEQRKIADFLSVADHQIALEKKRLESMRLIKKGLLQKMFV